METLTSVGQVFLALLFKRALQVVSCEQTHCRRFWKGKASSSVISSLLFAKESVVPLRMLPGRRSVPVKFPGVVQRD